MAVREADGRDNFTAERIGTFGVSCSATGLRSKKIARAAEQEKADVKGAREAWIKGQIDLGPEKLIFIDETGATTKMARLYGRAPRGAARRAAVPYGHWKTTTTFTAEFCR